MFIMTDNQKLILPVSRITRIFKCGPSKYGKYEVRCIVDNGGTVIKETTLGSYDEQRQADYVFGQLFSALEHGESYAVPHMSDLPDFNYVHRSQVSFKANRHGGS